MDNLTFPSVIIVTIYVNQSLSNRPEMEKENKDTSNCPVEATEEVSVLMKDVKLDSQVPEKAEKSESKWMDKMRMDQASFDHLLTLVTPEFKKANCKRNPEERLRQALEYLATGKGCSPADEEMITKTCLTFVEVLGEEYLTVKSLILLLLLVRGLFTEYA